MKFLGGIAGSWITAGALPRDILYSNPLHAVLFGPLLLLDEVTQIEYIV
jgi:hypothetical protein